MSTPSGASTGGSSWSANVARVVSGCLLAGPSLAAAAVGAVGAYRMYHPPRRSDGKSPAEDGLAVRSFEVVTTMDGIALSGWIVPGRGPDTVIACHGIGRNKSAVLAHLRMLHAAGHHVVAYDLRNHGTSGGDRAYGGMASRFVSDLGDIVGYVRDDPEVGGGKLALLAFSFSTWPAIQILADPTMAMSAVICDSGPTVETDAAFRRVFEQRRSTMNGLVRRSPLYDVCLATFRLVGRHMLAAKGWPPDLEGLATHLLFISGEQDPIVAPGDVAALAERYPGATLWSCPAASHTNGIRACQDEYIALVTSFLAEAFEPATPPRTGPGFD